MASLREEIWDVVLPEVQEFRLDAASDGGSISDACHDLASVAIRTREAAALNAEGRMLSDEDLDWMWDQLSALLGAGPMERFLRRSDVENIYVFGPNRAVLGLTGGRQEHVLEPVFASEEDMVRYVSHLATTHGQTGRRFDQSAPLLDLRLRSGERIFAAMAVCGTPFLDGALPPPESDPHRGPGAQRVAVGAGRGLPAGRGAPAGAVERAGVRGFGVGQDHAVEGAFGRGGAL